MKIFRVTIENTQSLETLVISNSPHEASIQASKAVKLGELEFDNDYELGIASCSEIPITEELIKEVKEYGVIDQASDLVYDGKIIKQLIADNKQRLKEEFLKKHHMEFDFCKGD